MKFNYELTGIGWASGEIEINNQVTHFEVSYLSDPITDLINGLLSLIPGCVPEDELKTKITFEWYEEPGGLLWLLEAIEVNKLKVTITSYEDIDHKNETNKRIDIETECDFLEFITLVTIIFENFIKNYGFIGYRNTWCRGEFPLSGLLILKNYINSRKPFPAEIEFNRGIEITKTNIMDEMELIL